MHARPRIVVDVSNLSIHAKKFIRTGIQEVVYKTLLSLAKVRSEFSSFEIILLPQLPRRFGNMLKGVTTVPYQNPAPFILESVEETLRLPSQDVWGFDLRGKGFKLTDAESFDKIAEAQFLHIQSMVNIHPLAERLREVGSPAANQLSMTVYDIAPVLFPEFCDHGLARWFQSTYLPAIGRFVKNAVCISRNTALDLQSNPSTSQIPQISVLPLPCDLGGPFTGSSGVLERLKLERGNYLIFLGSLEPRKNFEALLDGFEVFKRQSPESRLKLVLVGSTGWKNFKIESRLKQSAFARDLLRAGYLSDFELSELVESAMGLAMLSHYEGYGLPLAQAYSKGVPVMTTLGSSLPEACGGDGIFVEPHDAFSVSAGIQLLMKTARGGSKAALENWTWDQYARELLRGIGPK